MATMAMKQLIIWPMMLCLTSFLATKLYLYLVSKGVGVPIYNHYPGKCRVIPGIECGAEDVAVTKNGLVFISSGYRGLTACDMKTLRGHIFSFDFKNPAANVTKLEIVANAINMEEFEPHGMSLWEKDNGNVTLFVVDHGVSERVQVFEYDPSYPHKLFHIDTIIDSEFICINDLVVLDERRFYITNYLKYCKAAKIATPVEGVLSLRTGSVVYYDGKQGRVVASQLQMANGVNLSPDGRFVFVAGSSSQSLYVFARNPENGSLALVNEVGLGSMPDNVEVERDSGDLLIGCHRGLNILFADHSGPLAAPSQVLHLHPTEGNWSNVRITEILSSDGHDFVRGSTVASYFKGRLLIGTVFHRLALCEDVKLP